MLSPSEIAKYIDLSALKPNLTYEEIDKICQDAIKYNFYSVCINPFFVKRVYHNLKDSNLKVCSVISFPLGADRLDIKVLQSIKAVEDGADELDIVWNISAFKSKDYKYIQTELSEIKKNTEGVIHKVIIETAYLSQEEKILAIKILKDLGIEFLKTSSGYAPEGAKVEDIKLFKSLADNKIKIKASGGIKDYEAALKMIQAGADRLGTSAGIQIVTGK